MHKSKARRQPNNASRLVRVSCVLAGCEWKTRYEMQIEMNQLLEMQAAALNEQIGEAKQTTKDGKSYLFILIEYFQFVF